MGLLDGGLQRVFGAAFGALYLPATLHRQTRTDDGEGSTIVTWTDVPVRAQLDATTEAMRQAASYTDTDQRILVLAAGVAPITTDDEITVRGQRWAIASVNQDPATSYYELRGQRA